MPSIKMILRALGLLIVLPLAGCISLPGSSLFDTGSPANTPDAVPHKEPRSKYGNMPSYVVFGKRYHTLQSSHGFVERGIASWYGPKFHGKLTSSREPYDMNAMTAAHTRLPLPSYVRVTNLETNKSIVVRVNDRGPFKKNRVIDLSRAAATKLGIIAKGTGLVEVRAVDPDSPNEPAPRYQPIKGDIYIQVGAFGDLGNAQRIKNRLAQALGRPVRISQVNQLYRVQAGPYQGVEETDRQATRIAQLGMNTYITIE